MLRLKLLKVLAADAAYGEQELEGPGPCAEGLGLPQQRRVRGQRVAVGYAARATARARPMCRRQDRHPYGELHVGGRLVSEAAAVDVELRDRPVAGDG